MAVKRILVVRLGAMGDIIHALPAVASLKKGHAGAEIYWAIHPRWRPLLENNPDVAGLIAINRREWITVRAAIRKFRRLDFDLAVDFQGLIQSAAVAWFSGAPARAGYCAEQAREGLAAALYNRRVKAAARHVVERNLEVAAACGGSPEISEFKIGPGLPEEALPEEPFVLGCPLAGWTSKQWPLEYWRTLAGLLGEAGVRLVVNGAPQSRMELELITGATVNCSGIAGLIWATRRAAAVVGVDSGPLHIAAALGKKGAAIYGPTDPARNGPYGAPIQVLRHPLAATTYKRGAAIDSSMWAIRPHAVFDVLRQVM
ncbi:MAG: glycosyltransferase family 9 protein [Bryobacterales bacterium]|nr:glycosyltransferase family 9 protein [Bryobacterales bacterium]